MIEPMEKYIFIAIYGTIRGGEIGNIWDYHGGAGVK
jgi:hypothetical protein